MDFTDTISQADPRGQDDVTPQTREVQHNEAAYLVTALTPRCLLVSTEDGAYLAQCSSWAAVWRFLDVVVTQETM